MGDVSIRAGDVQITEDRLAGRQGRLLFAYLVTQRGRAVPRDELADVLWGDSPPATWEKALTVLVSKLRAALGGCGLDGASALTGARGYYRLDLPDDTWVDMDAAAAAVADAAVALVDGEVDRAAANAGAALEILRRPFLPGDDGIWIEAKRRELADAADEALACLSDAHLAAGRAAEAARVAEEAIALQPFRESGYRRLMQAHAAAGNRAEALRVYDRCRRLLLEELGAYPSPETEAIFRELLKEPEPGGAPAPAQSTQPPEPPAAPPAPPAATRPRRRTLIAGAVAALAALAAAVVVLVNGDDDRRRAVGANSVASIDAANGRVAEVTAAQRGYTSISAGPGDLWATDPANSAVVRLDASDGSVRDTIPVGAAPAAVLPAYGSVWVANAGDRTVSRVSPERGAVVQTISVGNGPAALAAGAGSLWVANRLDSTLVRVDARDGRIRATVPLAAAPAGVAFADGWVWVTGESPATVSRIDPGTNEVAQTVNAGTGAEQIAAAGRSVWVTNPSDGTVSRIDARSNRLTATVAVGGVPLAVAAAPGGVWVARSRPGALVKVDPAGGRVVRTIAATAPVAVTAMRDHVWLATGEAARRGGTLRVATALDADSSLDPATGAGLENWSLLASVYDGLVGYRRVGGTAGYTVVPDLARSLPTVSNGGRTYRFELRRGIRFSNGQPVRASDFKHTFARVAHLQQPPSGGYYSGIESVAADDAKGTILIRLRRPDPEFLNKLALPFGWVVPASTPMREQQKLPPATGPYRIASVVPGRQIVLTRNARFRPWSATAQPPGNPDRIVVQSPAGAAVSVGSIEHADLAVGQPESGSAAQDLVARYAARMHTVPMAANLFAFLNTRVRPFDDARVRRAVNYAVDRRAVARATGAPLLAQVTCQALAPGLLGYRPYCPYTRGNAKAGVWTGPDLAKARQLIAASGRRGERVTVLGFSDYAAAARELASAMRRIGLNARAKLLPPEQLFPQAADTRRKVQASVLVWLADSQTPQGFLYAPFDCKALVPANPANSNYAQFCDARSQRSMDAALAAQATDLGRAGRLWARADRAITDAAPVVPLASLRMVSVLSRRAHGYQLHPVIGPLISRLSVR